VRHRGQRGQGMWQAGSEGSRGQGIGGQQEAHNAKQAQAPVLAESNV
jgi:hypothetical protein